VNQKVVLAMLRKRSYTIEVANNGQQALEMLEKAQTPYDLILMDVQMPVMDGMEATRRIRKHPEYGGIPIVAMTANVMTGDREKSLEVGMNGYLPKPIQLKQLTSTIEGLLTAEMAQV